MTMKIVSISLSTISAGDHLAVPFSDGFYLGEVVKVYPSYVSVKYGDKSTSNLRADLLKRVLKVPQQTKLGTKPFTRAEVLSLRKQPTDSVEEAPQDTAADAIADEVPLYLPRSFVDRYEAATKPRLNRAAMLKLMRDMWLNLNASRFHGALSPAPNFGFMRDSEVRKLKAWAHFRTAFVLDSTPEGYSPVYYIEFHPKSFLDSFKKFAEVFLHEMCHEAVAKISKLRVPEPNKGHGPVWAGWMRKVGLDPVALRTYGYDAGTEAAAAEEYRRHHEKLQKKSDERYNQRVIDYNSKAHVTGDRSPVVPHKIKGRMLVTVLRKKPGMSYTMSQGIVILQDQKRADVWLVLLAEDLDSNVLRAVSARDIYYPSSEDSSYVFQALTDSYERTYTRARSMEIK